MQVRCGAMNRLTGVSRNGIGSDYDRDRNYWDVNGRDKMIDTYLYRTTLLQNTYSLIISLRMLVSLSTL